MAQQADVYNENCPSRIVLNIIGNKWVILIIQKLENEPVRFGELKRHIGGISAKVLTQSLKLLEQHGLITRTEYSTLPLKVEYSLTSTGKSLCEICKQITLWAENNFKIC